MATAVEYRGMYSPNNTLMGYVNSDTRIGDEVVTSGLASDLQAFYDKTSSSTDKSKALQLLSALRTGGDHSEDPVPRPHTAMPSVGYHSNPYVTSYTRDYPQKEVPFTGATRPMTSHGFKNGKVGHTTYGEEYKQKPNRPASPIRSGSASGARCNKPHPLQSFMVWRFPAKAKAEDPPSPWSAELTDDMINQVHKRLCQSTYQTDYLGVPQGFQLKSAYTLPEDWKKDIPYTLDSVARYSYQNPKQEEELKLPVSRYGSNKKKSIAVNGTIPTASSRYNHIKQRTTYDRHYNDNTGAVVQQIKDVGRKLGAEALKKYYENAAPEDQDTIKRLLDVYKAGEAPVTKPIHAPAPPTHRPSSRMSNRSYNAPVTPLSDPESAQINFINKGSHSNSPARTPVPMRKPGSRLACTPVSDFNYTGNRPLQVTFPMQVPMPNMPISPPYSPPGMLN